MFIGLVSLLAVSIGLRLLSTLLAQLIPVLTSTVIVLGVLLWFFRQKYS